MEKLPNFLNLQDNAWHRTSATIETAAKIYGIRVDVVHSATYKFVSELSKSKQELQNSRFEKNSFMDKKKVITP